ncbi:hypothetical protein GIB67_020507, partial [Kingdonia uniflora]
PTSKVIRDEIVNYQVIRRLHVTESPTYLHMVISLSFSMQWMQIKFCIKMLMLF